MMANKPIEVKKEEIPEKTEKDDNKIINKEGEKEQLTNTETTEINMHNIIFNNYLFKENVVDFNDNMNMNLNN